jgi:hypothetical protein
VAPPEPSKVGLQLVGDGNARPLLVVHVELVGCVVPSPAHRRRGGQHHPRTYTDTLSQQPPLPSMKISSSHRWSSALVFHRRMMIPLHSARAQDGERERGEGGKGQGLCGQGGAVARRGGPYVTVTSSPALHRSTRSSSNTTGMERGMCAPAGTLRGPAHSTQPQVGTRREQRCERRIYCPWPAC